MTIYNSTHLLDIKNHNGPYTYLIECPDGRKYYGVRYAKNANTSELWVTYFTSSKEIHNLIKIYGKETFKFSVRKIFICKQDAIEWETEVLTRLHVRTNNDWVNKANNKGIPPMYGDDNPSRLPESRNKISRAKTGKSRPDQRERLLSSHHMKTEKSRVKLSKTKKRLYAEGKLVNPYKGKKRPEMSGKNHHRYGKKYEAFSVMNSIEYTCPHCNKIGKGPGMKRYHFDNCKLKCDKE